MVVFSTHGLSTRRFSPKIVHRYVASPGRDRWSDCPSTIGRLCALVGILCAHHTRLLWIQMQERHFCTLIHAVVASIWGVRLGWLGRMPPHWSMLLWHPCKVRLAGAHASKLIHDVVLNPQASMAQWSVCLSAIKKDQVSFPSRDIFSTIKTNSFAMTVWGKGLSAISCASLIENLVDKQFVHHHQTSILVAKRDGGPSNKVKTFIGQTVGGGYNHE